MKPLIKDEKIRKALRAAYDAAPYRDNVVYFDGRWTFRGDKFEVMFDDREIKIEGWTEGKAYHIEELCGEEEECRLKPRSEPRRSMMRTIPFASR